MGEHLASLADTRLLALDLRGHGETEVSNDDDNDDDDEEDDYDDDDDDSGQ